MFKIECLNPYRLSFKWKKSYKCFCVTAVIGTKFFPNGIAIHWLLWQVPDIIDNAYVIVEFDNGSRGMLDLCMFAEGSKNEQEISVVGDIGKVELSLYHPFTVLIIFSCISCRDFLIKIQLRLVSYYFNNRCIA